MRLSQFDQRAIQPIHRAWVLPLLGNILDDVVPRERQPRLDWREAGGLPAIPLHRRARSVAPKPFPGHSQLEWIAHVFGPDRDLLHPDLVAVIDRRRAS